MCFRLQKAVSSDKLVGSGLLLLSILIFVYYTVWVIVLVSLLKMLTTDYRPQCARRPGGMLHGIAFCMHQMSVQYVLAVLSFKPGGTGGSRQRFTATLSRCIP